jgi:putative copper export protein
MAIVAVIAGIGAYNHLTLVPRLGQGRDPSAERLLRRLGMIEVVLLAIVLGVTSVLVALAG